MSSIFNDTLANIDSETFIIDSLKDENPFQNINDRIILVTKDKTFIFKDLETLKSAAMKIRTDLGKGHYLSYAADVICKDDGEITKNRYKAIKEKP